MRIGLFGGSFNPPHVAHLIVAETLREAADLDTILWIPAPSPPHKGEEHLAPFDHRLAMVRSATRKNPNFAVSDMEKQRAGKSYTIDTILELKAANPRDEYSLLLGGDSMIGFPEWKRPEDIVEEVALVVYPRPGFSPDRVNEAFRSRFLLCEAPLLDLSGTLIRGRLHTDRSIRYLVPDSVRSYIRKHSLYSASSDS